MRVLAIVLLTTAIFIVVYSFMSFVSGLYESDDGENNEF